MSYAKHTWETNEAITKEKLNNIEDGIVENKTANGNTANQVTELNTKVENYKTALWQGLGYRESELSSQTIRDRISSLTIPEGLTDDVAALKFEVESARGQGDNTLQATLQYIKDNINSVSTVATRADKTSAANTTSINNARGTYTTLKDRIDTIVSVNDEAHSQFSSDITTISNTLSAPVQGNSNSAVQLLTQIVNANRTTSDTLDNRFDDLDTQIGNILGNGNNTLQTQLTNVKTEIESAHVSTANGNTTYTTLDDRLEADETNIGALQTEVDAAHRSEVQNDTLDNRFYDIETELTGAKDTYNSIDARFDAVETTANAAAVAATVSTALDRLDSRLDAIDGGFTFNSTNGTLVAHVTNLETAIDYTPVDQNDETPAGLTQRITAIETTIGDNSNGLVQQVNSIGTTVGDNSSGLVSQVNEIITTIGDNSSGIIKDINDLDNAIDHVASGNDPGGLTQRIIDLEGKQTIIIGNPGSGNSNYTNNEPNISEPSSDVNYLIWNNDKYYYWRYINNSWELISGAGNNQNGGGTSSGEFAASLQTIDNPDKNKDYFVGSNIIGYTHYRYIPSETEGQNGTFIKILPSSLTKDASTLTTSIIKDVNNNEAWQWPLTQTFSGNPAIYNVEDTNDVTNLLNDFIAVRNARINAVYEGDDPNNQTLKSQTLQILDTKGHLMEYPIVGGGGGGNAYSIRFLSTMPNSIFTVPADESYKTIVTARAVVKQGNVDLEGVQFGGSVMYRLSTAAENAWINSSITLPAITNNKEFSVDVSSLLTTNRTTVIRIILNINTGDGDPVQRYVDYTITKTQISISSTFNSSSIVTTNNLIVPYTCYGVNLTKTVYFKIDGENAITPVTTSKHNEGSEVSIPLNNYQQGAHSLQIYFTADGSVTSNKLNYYFIYSTDASNAMPIVGLSVEKEEITYGDELIVNYTAYTPGQETTDKVEIKLYTLDANEQQVIYENKVDTRTDVRAIVDTWKTTSYPEPITPQEGQPEQPITVYISVTAYHYITTENNGTIIETAVTDSHVASVVINRFTNPNNYDFSEIDSRNILYSYTAYGKTNNDDNHDDYEYTYIANDGNDTSITFHGGFNDFNWATDGYVDGTSLTISGGAQHTINVPIFSTEYNNIPLDAQSANDITQYGRTIEIDYEVRSATDLNATIIECIDPNTHAGIKITPNYCYLTNTTTPAQIDDDGFILNESSIAAAYLQTNTRIHLMFVIEPWSQTKAYDKTYHQSVNIYINGEYANSCAYERGVDGNIIDSFTTNATFTFGSDTCILKLYGVKLYNRGLTQKQALQAYRLAPTVLSDKIVRFANNDILDNAGYVSYEKARKRYNCLLLVGPDPTAQATLNWPTISPFKGSKSPAQRKKKATDVDYEGKTESGLIFTKPSSDPTKQGYEEIFRLCDKVPVGAPAYLGAAGAYCSSNNVQGTSSQKYPLHNLKVYLAKWQAEKTQTKQVALEPGEEVPEGVETIEEDGVTYKIVTETTPAQIKKVKYSLKGYNDDGTPKGTEESTFCWKADYMSTDHANTYNANIADGLFSDKLLPNWDDKKYQNTVYGIRCLLFQQQGDEAAPVFVGDGCLNNDKGNTKTYGLEVDGDDGADTLRQKWEFTNNTSPLDVFKSDNLFGINEKDSDHKIYAKGAFECSYPDEGDLKDDGIQPNYNHLQLMLTWVNKRACYLDYSVFDEDTNETTNYTVSDTAGTGGTYNGVNYSTERELKRAIFKNEFEQHFNLNHVLTYYIFSEYIALCDNRAKNMFMRAEDIRSEVIYNTNGQKILDGNVYPDDGTLWNNFVNTSTGITNPSVINWNTTGTNHSTFAKWAPVLYDLDSCFGVENVGLITIKYNADWQYKYNNKEAFSGFDSVFWLMVEDTYADEIRTLAKSLYNNDLNFTNFYKQQITDNKNATCPALVNQDMILKYDIPWNEGFINYSKDPDPETGEYPKETPLYKYIQRGTRSTQKTTFMRQRSMLLSSKYVSTEFTNNTISFRAGVLVTGEDTLLQLVANQDLYPAIMFGDSNTLVRPSYIIQDDQRIEIDSSGYVSAGVPCQIITSQIGNTDTVKIVGASVLNDIGDLSKYQPYELKVSSGTNLKRLIIGSNAAGYINTSTESIEGLSDCVLLEEINVRNTTKIGSLNLGGNGLIKKVYAGGSNITTISLPNGGVLNEIEYSDNTTNITLLNQKFLQSFTYEEDNNHYALAKLWIENTPKVPVVDIVLKALDRDVPAIPGKLRGELKGGIRLCNIDVDLFKENGTEEENELALNTTTQFLETIVNDLMLGKYLDSTGTLSSDATKHPEINGIVHITKIRTSLLQKIKNWYPNLIIYATKTQQGIPIEINGNNVIQEYDILYYNYGYDEDMTPEEKEQWLLYTDHRTDQEHYIDPASTYIDDLDPVTHTRRIPAERLVKPEDAAYYYTFGAYAEDNYGNLVYTRFSGWKALGADSSPSGNDYVQGRTVFIAQYPTKTDRYYTVNWYAEPNESAIQTITAKYGTDITIRTQPEEGPNLIKAKLTNDGVYKVFKGWDRPIGKLVADTDIYAQWETSSIGNSIQSVNMDQLTAADLYAIANIGSQARIRVLGKLEGNQPIKIKMGNDFNYTSGVNTTDLLNGSEKVRLTGESTNVLIRNNITPLANLKSDWTIAIDYKFLMDSSISSGREFVLMSCYQNNNGAIQGFKVSLNKSSTIDDPNMYVHVTWGDKTTSVALDTITLVSGANNAKQYCKSSRNVIVLRHNSVEQYKLYIYSCGFNGTQYWPSQYDPQSTYNFQTYTTDLTYESNITLNTPLIIGGNYSGTTTSIETTNTRRPAKAMVYYAKYWDTDLGNKNCLLLAAWPHETEYFVLTGYDNNSGDNSENSTRMMPNTKLTFAAAQGFGDRMLKQPDNYSFTNFNRCGWESSYYRTVCNGRIYNAFPITYRNIMGKYTISSVYYDQIAANTIGEQIVGGISDTQDYIYLASEQEVGGVFSETDKQSESLRFWPWLSSSNVKAYTGSNGVLRDANVGSINPLRYRFLGKPFTTDTRIFYNTPNPALTDEWTYQYTDDQGNQHDEQISVQSGDVWYTEDVNVNANFNGSSNAFIYYTNAEINEGVYVDIVTTNGGWKRAGYWELRTYNYDNTMTYGNINRFEKINEQGALVYPKSNSAGNTSTRILCPEFAI